MKYIETFREGMHVSDVYLCKTKQIALTKNGKEYGSVTLQDKTGTIDGKIWDLGSPGIGEFGAMDYIFTPSPMSHCWVISLASISGRPYSAATCFTAAG